MIASYTSKWDNGTEVTSKCHYDPDTKVVSDIESTDIDVGDACLTSESVTLPDGTELNEEDHGVTFDY